MAVTPCLTHHNSAWLCTSWQPFTHVAALLHVAIVVSFKGNASPSLRAQGRILHRSYNPLSLDLNHVQLPLQVIFRIVVLFFRLYNFF